MSVVSGDQGAAEAAGPGDEAVAAQTGLTGVGSAEKLLG